MRHPGESKKEHKKALAKKNRFHQEMFQWLRLRRQEAERVKALEEGMKAKPSAKSEEIGDKVAQIRNRLTGRKRISRERWNRFAGTSGGGGRGL